MFIAVLKLEIHIPASNSLKHKRMILNSFKGRMRSSFNVSVAEIGGHDKWQRAAIAVCQVGKDRKYLHHALDKILKFTEQFRDIDLLNHEMEIV